MKVNNSNSDTFKEVHEIVGNDPVMTLQINIINHTVDRHSSQQMIIGIKLA